MSEDFDDEAAAAAVRAGDHAAFSALAERYRRRLRAHCYRMLGSFDDAEDMVQETLLRAWRARDGFEGRARFGTWLYRIATNVCLNARERAPRRVLPEDVAPAVTTATPASEARSAPRHDLEIPWLRPCPDELLETRENVQLAFIAALQRLPPRQRAALILTEVVGWSAAEAAELLELSVAAVNSAVGRARETLRARAAERTVAGRDEELLRRWMSAWESGDVAALTALLRDDARWSMPPAPLWFDGRAAIAMLLARFPPRWNGRDFRMVAAHANGQPSAAAYLRQAGESTYRLTALHVLSVVDEQIAEITTFSKELCGAFQLPPELDR